MGRKSVVRNVILCAAVAAVLVGVATPEVYAKNYPLSNVIEGDTVIQGGDVLEFPEGVDQGMLICYLDEYNNVLANVNTEKGKDYIIPAYNSLGIYSRLEVGTAFEGWKVQKKPTEGTSQPQWELIRCLKSNKDASSGDAENAIYLTGSYELTKDTIYTLKGGLAHVRGDATTYANEIIFTVDTETQYTFK